MNKIFSYYTKYLEHIDEYKSWQNSNTTPETTTKSCANYNNEVLKQKAKVIADPILLFDNYEHEKAEDAETFFMTFNIELMSITSLLCSLPIAVTKLVPFLNNHADKSKIIKNLSNTLTKYNSKNINIGSKSISLPKIITAIAAIGACNFYASGMKKSMESQLGLIRKASFDASQNLINNPKYFAIHTKEQENQINSIVNYDNKHKSAFVDKLKDKVDINSSFTSVRDYTKNKKEYNQSKDEYFKKIKEENLKTALQKPSVSAQQEQKLFESLLKNVEHDVLEQLRKVETIANISYSAIFTGGFLEYLITDKLTDVLKIQNTAVKTAMKISIPIITYLILNKNISDIENKAILATKYKHLKNFTENPAQYNGENENNKKESIFEFIKNIYNDMKEYEEFSKNEIPKIKQKFEAKQAIELTKQQENEAKILQRNTAMVLNNQRERVYEQTVGIKALSETVLGPMDILATALGNKIGFDLSKKCNNPKLSSLLRGICAVLTFIPVACIEAKLTKQQKMAEKIAVMLSIKDINDKTKFDDKSRKMKDNLISDNNSPVFQVFNK